MKMYFRGAQGIGNPLDAKGVQIKEGDKLTWDFHDDFYQERGVKGWMKSPIFIVKKNAKGQLYGDGIEKELYLHDFRFKYCEVIKSPT